MCFAIKCAYYTRSLDDVRSDNVIALNFVTCYGMTGGRLERAACLPRFIESNGGLLTMYRQFLSEIFNNGVPIRTSRSRQTNTTKRVPVANCGLAVS